MRKLRTGTPQPELWEEADVMAHLGYDENKAKEIMKECRKRNGIIGYSPVEKHLILEFVNEKQREEREREARYNADIAITRQISTLEEQVKALKEQARLLDEMNRSSSEDARRARTQSLVANFISGISLAIAIIALILKLG